MHESMPLYQLTACMHATKSNLQSLNIFQDKELLVTIVFTISKEPMRRLDDNPALF